MNEDTIESIVFYYPSDCRSASGEIYVRTSSYTREAHYSGAAIIDANHPDYALWLWVMPRLLSAEYGRVSSNELEEYRPMFEQERQQSASEDAFQEQLLAAVPVCPKPTNRQRVEEAISSFLEPASVVFIFGFLFIMAVVTAPFTGWKRFSQWLHTKRPSNSKR